MRIDKFELELWMNQHELNVQFDIAESGISPLSTQELFAFAGEHAQKSLAAMPLGYNDANGSLALREEIAKTYATAKPENILITIGAIEANFLLFNAILEPGDHVVAPYPAYQQLYSVPQAIGCDVSFWHSRPENKFQFDLDELKKLVTPKTKLIVINFPHNPTGTTLTESQLEEVYSIAEAAGALLLSDEAYRWLTIPGSTYEVPLAFDLGPAAISVGTMSKPFGLPGLRIGWMVASRELIERCRTMRHYVSLCPGKADDFLAMIALRNKEKIFARNAEIITENLSVLEPWLDKHSDLVSWNRPQAGLLGMLHYSADVPSRQLADRLATDYSTLLAPGSVFGLENHLRLGFGNFPALFKQGIAAVERCFNESLLAAARR